MITVQYIWHDCFYVETNSIDIVFDFWEDPVTRNEYPEFINRRDNTKPLFVFVSHHHKDHYTKDIFNWVKKCRNIHFILSNDTARFARHIISPTSIYSGFKPKLDQVSVMKRGDKLSIGNIMVEAFGSTDIGNSYYVEVDGYSIFHAGDLNAWVWMEESTENEIEKALNDFTDIVKKIQDKYPVVDYSFFPVDARLGQEYFTGAAIYLRRIFARHFFPMHFCLCETISETVEYKLKATDFSKYCNPERGEYISLTEPYSTFMSCK